MDYHPFKKTVKGKNGKTKRVFYYWYYDANGTQKQRVIKDKSVKTVYDAGVYCGKLPPLKSTEMKIKDVAAEMFIPGSDHLRRREQMGHSCKQSTLYTKRLVLRSVVAKFGESTLSELKVTDVFNYLAVCQKSFAWKNSFVSALRDIYQNAAFYGINVAMPNFPTFKGRHRKADPLLDAELPLLLDRKNFTSERNYLLFLLMTSAGLRVSETRAFQARQFLRDSQMVLVDGSIDRDNKTRNPYNKGGNAENPKWRIVVIPEITAKTLGAFIDTNGLADNDFVFTTANGKTLLIAEIRHAFFTALKRSGIADAVSAAGRRLTIHSLRHTFVTRTRAYLDADTVRQMAGHSAIEMTEYYTHKKIQDDVRNLAAHIKDANQFFLTDKR